MLIDKEQIIDLLQGQGLMDQASSAVTALPDVVDTVANGDLLQQIGVDPTQLTEQLSGITEVAGEHATSVTEAAGEHATSVSEGGIDGLVDKITSFLGGGRE